MYNKVFENYVNNIRLEGRYRDFVDLTRLASEFPYAINNKNGEKTLMWCINDYLGMSSNHQVIKASKDAIEKSGIGSGGTRNIGGTSAHIVELEKTIANLHNKDRGLLFTSGYIANDATLVALAKIIPEVVFFSDELNHASIISGIRSSGAEKYVYNHVDMDSLEKGLKKYPIDRPKVIVFESVYSMNGLFSPMHAIVELAKKYNALTYVDEVHSVGMYGKGGAGLASEFGISDKIDIIQGTFAKAYGTIGGYITGNTDLIDSIRLSAPSFIFTTSLPPLIAAAATASVKYLQYSDKERMRHQDRVATLKKALDKAGIKYYKNYSHIIPIMVNDPVLVSKISEKLLNEHKMYVQHINYPTVPKGTERLRITITPAHTDEMIHNLIVSIIQVFAEVNLKIEEAA